MAEERRVEAGAVALYNSAIKQEGILVGHSSAAAMLGALKLAAKIESGVIVTVFPDSCERCYVNFGQFKKYYENEPTHKIPKAD